MNIKTHDNNTSFIKTDDNKLINVQQIKWIKKMNDCLEVCIKSNRCNLKIGDTHTICKKYTPNSFNSFNQLFDNS